MFDHVYSEPHPLIEEQKAWLQKYESELGGHSPADGDDGVNYGGTR
jgi:pyruvate dehydrogenase E1 component alpha subunit